MRDVLVSSVVGGVVASLLIAPPVISTAAQEAAPAEGRLSGARVMEVRTEPETPTFGEVFRVHVTVRLPRRSDLALVDTLGSSNFFRSAGPGSWEAATPEPSSSEDSPPTDSPAGDSSTGDSLDVRATFPVLPFRDGVGELPGVLVETEDAGRAPGVNEPPERLALGEVEVAPLAGFGPEGGDVIPRPPADVVGGDWSPWALLAGGTILLGLLGLGRTVLRERPHPGDGAGSGPPVEGVGALDRASALRRLEKIRAAGWHQNGRSSDFYQATTDTLRRFVEGADPDWSEALTSTELLDRAAGRWGRERLDGLPDAVERAEWVKFGDARPDADEAERDWAVIRDWIREAP